VIGSTGTDAATNFEESIGTDAAINFEENAGPI